MDNGVFVVEELVATDKCDINLRNDSAWGMAVDQRAFGPRRLLVAATDDEGNLLALAHTRRAKPPERGLAPCLMQLAHVRPAAVLAFCDEPVREGPAPKGQAQRYENARTIAAEHGVKLVDWFACDDQAYRSFQIAFHVEEGWWGIPLDDDEGDDDSRELSTAS